MSLPRYPQYKDSGVEWLGRVPAHWSVSPLKRHMALLTEKAEGRRWPVALENVESWSGRFVPTEGDFQGDGVAFAASDILFGKLRPYLAKVFLAAHDGEAVGDFHVVRPGGTLFPRYAQYQMLQRQFIDVVDGSTFGSKMPRASWESLGGMPLVVPEYEEQRSIAFFLDRETAKIDALIAEQEKLLALLAEKRQATISHAVTRGLDPNAPMKDSGIPWLGQIPAHWDVRQIKRVVSSIEQGWSPQCENYPVETAGEWGVLKVGCVNGGVFTASENKKLPDDLEPVPGYALRAGDLLVSRANTRELVGSAAVVPEDYPNLLLCDKLYRLRVIRTACDPRFAAAFLGTPVARSQIELDATGASSSMLNIGQSVILDLPVPIPPIDEQRTIMRFIADAEERIEQLRLGAQRAIDLLKERRSALIAAAVTGQIDVRGTV